MINVLYLGMADDIVSPIVFEPDFDTIYVLDLFDPAFSPDGTLKGQQEEIKKILSTGDITGTHRYRVMKRYNKDYKGFQFEKSHILSEKYQNDTYEILWYNTKVRRLKIFYTDFHEQWPEEIQDIKTMIILGSCHLQDITMRVSPKRIFSGHLHGPKCKKYPEHMKYYDDPYIEIDLNI